MLDRETLDVVAIGGAAAAGLALLVSASTALRIGRMKRAYTVLQGRDGTADFVTAVERKVAEVKTLRGEIGELRGTLGTVQSELADAIRHVAVVRYDAFPDMGGRLSFSAALLDDAGDGLVLTSINGRTETRTYAKGVKGGRSDAKLSPEETQAIGFATRNRGRSDG